jgi:UDP-glucose:(heptosyl)LPS alpha-1,3-glucosyltransferase
LKKIALAIENFDRHAGGAESYAVALAETLRRSGWQVHLFGRSWGGEPPGAVFHEIPIPSYLPSWAQMLLFARRHREMVGRERFDVILGFGNTTLMNVYQSHGGVHRLSTARKIYSERNRFRQAVKRLLVAVSPKQSVRNWVESAPFRERPRPRIIAISRMIKDDLIASFDISGEEIDVIYNGVDTTRYNPKVRDTLRGPLRRELGLGEADTLFLLVSFDLKKKGILPLVEAARELRQRKGNRFRVVVVGGVPYPSLAKKIQRLGLGETVLFPGPTRAVETYYANADAFVLPTYYDACSLVVIEAMACGLPAVTTTANGAAGLIADGENGFILSHPPDASQLADRMERLMSVAARKRLSAAAGETGRRCSAEKNHREMVRIFEAMVSARPDPGNG